MTANPPNIEKIRLPKIRKKCTLFKVLLSKYLREDASDT